MRPFGDYVLLGELGRGGASVVWEARHLTIDRPCALKILSDSSDSNRKQRTLSRFLFEAEVLARLDHPSVVRVHAAGEVEGQRYIELELIEGGTLADYLAGNRPAPRQAAQWTRQLAEGLAHAHGRGVLHRDIKPGNVLLTAEDRVKLTDFGLAREMEAPMAWTRTLGAIGTPAFMAPEVAREGMAAFTPRADIYGLGAVLYQMLTGVPPHAGKDPLEILERVRNRVPQRPRDGHPDVPVDLEVICLRCMDLDPNRRFGSAAEVVDELQLYLAGLPIRSRPAGPFRLAQGWVRRHPALAGSLTLSATLALAGFSLVSWNWLRANRLAQRLAENLVLAQVRSAQIEREAGGSQQALAELAAAVRQDIRDGDSRRMLEYWLHEGAFVPPTERVWAPGEPVSRVSYSRDGRRILAHLANGEVRVYPRDSTNLLLQVPGMDPGQFPLGFTGPTLLTHQTHGVLTLWKLPEAGSPPSRAWQLKDVRRSAVSDPPNHWAGVDASGRVWFGSLAPGSVPQQVAVHPASIRWSALAVSPVHGKVVGAESGADWDLWEGDKAAEGSTVEPWELRRLPGRFPVVSGMTFSPRGSGLLVYGGTRAELWNVATGDRKFAVPASEVWSGARFDGSGNRLLLFNDEGSVSVFKTFTGGKALLGPELEAGRLVRVGEPSTSDPRGVLLTYPAITPGADGTLRFHPRTNQHHVASAEHGGRISAFALHPSHTHVLSAGENGEVREWRWMRDRWGPEWVRSSAAIQVVSAVGEGTPEISALDDEGLLGWLPSTPWNMGWRLPDFGRLLPVPGPEPGTILGVDQAGLGLLIATRGGMVTRWPGRLPEPARFLAQDVSGRRWAGAGASRLWLLRHEAGNWAPLESLELPGTRRLMLPRYGDRIWALQDQGDLWPIDTRPQLRLAGSRWATGVRDVTLTGDGRFLVLITSAGNAEVMDLAKPSSPSLLFRLDHPIRVVAVSPGNGRVAVASQREVRLGDVYHRHPEVTLAGFTQPVVALAFAPGGDVLAVGTQGDELRLFTTRTGQALTSNWSLSSTNRPTGVLSLCFTPDRLHLVGSTSAGRVFRLNPPRTTEEWIGPTDPLLDLADYLAGRRLVNGDLAQRLTALDLQTLRDRLLRAQSQGRWDPGWDRYLPSGSARADDGGAPSVLSEP